MEDPKYLECSCGDCRHILRFVFDAENKELFTEVQLIQPNNLFRRLQLAFWYILGKSNPSGLWDCTLLDEKGVLKLTTMLTSFILRINADRSGTRLIKQGLKKLQEDNKLILGKNIL